MCAYCTCDAHLQPNFNNISTLHHTVLYSHLAPYICHTILSEFFFSQYSTAMAAPVAIRYHQPMVICPYGMVHSPNSSYIYISVSFNLSTYLSYIYINVLFNLSTYSSYIYISVLFNLLTYFSYIYMSVLFNPLTYSSYIYISVLFNLSTLDMH